MWIGRRLDGTVYGAWTNKQPADEHHPGMEEVSDNHPDVIAFMNRPRPSIIDPVDELRLALKADPTLLDKIKALK